MRSSLILVFLATLCATMLGCGDLAVKSVSGGKVVEVAWSGAGGAAPDTIRLGRIREGEIVGGEFIICNISSQPLVIVDIRVACGCAKAEFDATPVMAGQSRAVRFTFNSSGRVGLNYKHFDVVAADGQFVAVYFEAEVVE